MQAFFRAMRCPRRRPKARCSGQGIPPSLASRGGEFRLEADATMRLCACFYGAGSLVCGMVAEGLSTDPEPGMAALRTVTVYIDYKSPYAYLAKDPAYELEREFDVRLDWLPYILDIPEFLGTV